MSQGERADALDVATLPLGPIGTNCFVVAAAGSTRGVVVDPGADAPAVLAAAAERGLELEAVLVTHCHWDHIGAVAPVARELSVPVYMSRLEAPVLADIDSFAPAQFGPYESYEADELLDGGERIEVAGLELEVLLLPGHSPGHLGFLHRGGDDHDDQLFSGDVLFQGSIGRYDLPFADGNQLFSTLRTMLDTLDDGTVVYPGHGPVTTIGNERRSNPFLLQLASL